MLVRDVLEPGDVLAIEMLLHRKVHHLGVWPGAMMPDTTQSVWPSGWVCHAVRARGSKRTQPLLIRAGVGASMMGFCHTVPVKDSAAPRREAVDPNGLISMTVRPPERSGACVLAPIGAA